MITNQFRVHLSELEAAIKYIQDNFDNVDDPLVVEVKQTGIGHTISISKVDGEQLDITDYAKW